MKIKYDMNSRQETFYDSPSPPENKVTLRKRLYSHLSPAMKHTNLLVVVVKSNKVLTTKLSDSFCAC